MSENKIYLSSSPHFTEGLSTQKVMLMVIISMLPECIAGVMFFGAAALVRILVSVAACVAFEGLYQKITKQKIRIANLSAVVSGILLALVIPSTTPVWMVVLGALVAMVVAKGLFGGIGANVFNPALTGRAFMFISFPAAMGACWFNPEIDAVSGATILSQIKNGAVTATPDLYMQYFLGNRAGCIGETSILLILISFLFLFATHIIDWRAPVAMVATTAICTLVSGGDVLLALLTGGLLFGATFMVTDYATSPLTGYGRLVFGFGCGLITFLIRKLGGYPEGVMFSILIMNCFTSFLNNLTRRMYGYGKKGNRRPAPANKVQEFDVANAVERKEESK
ncbi:RnfABCDGE type electron transport complex subunit D [Treponema sp.]|uniref:RnfABCDGE type electron transport complex subunit D n=1 Tax=Treponema sp. TaxID=166 RepID=UPI00298D8309|nr:RnfABCDGE type electron transport complex subunit D [Treponema sp.]MCQ2240193.1 RnfABCDGE type electron transport complex subunit D [Treponema sp.]